MAQTVVQGGSLTLSVCATGRPSMLGYRWFANGINVATMVLAQSNCFFTITNLQPTSKTNIFYYRVAVTNVAGLTNSPLVPVTILPDNDHDGIPDDWEISHHLDPANSSDALLDSDGDGLSNLREYLSAPIRVMPAPRFASIPFSSTPMGCLPSTSWPCPIRPIASRYEAT